MQRREIRGGTAAHEKATTGFRKTAETPEPTDHSQLHSGGGRSAEPGAIENVKARGERVSHGADVVPGSRDEGEEARMIDVKIAWEHLALEAREELVGIGRRLWRIFCEAA